MNSIVPSKDRSRLTSAKRKTFNLEKKKQCCNANS